jgi:hypothetical protein
MAAGSAEDTVQAGLLMEAAQAQQSLAVTALERLHAHTAGLDAVVREEIRGTLLEEMHALGQDARRAAEALRRLQCIAGLRLTLWSITIMCLSAVLPLAITWWVLPSRADLTILLERRDELAGNLARLAREGGNLDLRHCGAQRRLCVRVDRGAPSYGQGGDFLVVKGY